MHSTNLLVFASHSSGDRLERANRDYLSRFVQDVESLLRAKLGLSSENSIVFLDARNIEFGDEWEPALQQAVCEARSILCLVSPNYLKSVWCGRELQVFLERREQLPEATPEESQSFVFPVFWEGHHRQYELPAVIRQFQYRLQDVPAEYEQRGVAFFYRTQKKSVSRICESVADAIAEAFRRNLSGVPPKLGILRLSELRNAFQDVQASQLYPISLFVSTCLRKQCVDDIVSEMFAVPFNLYPLDLRNQFADLQAVLTAGVSDRLLFCVLTHDEEAGLIQVLTRLSDSHVNQVGIIFVLPGNEEAEIEDRSQEDFWGQCAVERIVVNSETELAGLVRAKSVEIRSRMISAGEGSRATDSELGVAASNDGIQVQVKPFLSTSRRTGREP